MKPDIEPCPECGGIGDHDDYCEEGIDTLTIDENGDLQMSTLAETFHKVIEGSVGPEGVFPHHCLWMKNGNLSMGALMLAEPRQIYATVMLTMIQELPDELIFGIDRFCLKGQGTTLLDCVAGAHYRDDQWHPFIIEYQHHPRIVMPIDWKNEFWCVGIMLEISKLLAGLRTNAKAKACN